MNGAPAHSHAAVLQALQRWSEAGWIRRLDAAFARFMAELDPDAAGCVLLAAGLAAHLEGRGHACLLLDELLGSANALLGWPPESMDELAALMAALPASLPEWLEAMRGSTLIGIDTDGQNGSQPLVLRGSKLYLRRYWRDERSVAVHVLRRVARPMDVDVARVRSQLDLLFPAARKSRVAECRYGSDHENASHESTDSNERNHAPDSAGPNAATDAATDVAQVDWQRLACAIALRGGLSIITGGPGTGKTYTAARLLALLFAVDADPQRLRVMLAAPTGKAAARLRQSIDTALGTLADQLGGGLPLHALAARIAPARTLHALLGARPDTRRFRFDAARPLELDVLIVDEASMVHLEMMAALLDALPPHARVIFLGDKDQLASVEAGAVLGDLCRGAQAGRYSAATAAYAAAAAGQALPAELVTGGPALAQQTVMLRHSHRFAGPIGQLALAVNAGDAQAAAALLLGDGAGALAWIDAPPADAVLRLALRGREGAAGGFGAYLAALAAGPQAAAPAAHEDWVRSVLAAFERFRLLCAVREGPWGALALNVAVERALAAAGLLSTRSEWYPGRPVMVTRNDRTIGVFNGDVGMVLPALASPGRLRAYFADGAEVRSVAVSRLADVETAFAMTVHKSQGSEFEHTVLVLPQAPSRVLTRELVYTGITRARRAFTLVSGRTQALADALSQQTRRASGLLELLDGEAG